MWNHSVVGGDPRRECEAVVVAVPKMRSVATWIFAPSSGWRQPGYAPGVAALPQVQVAAVKWQPGEILSSAFRYVRTLRKKLV